MSNTHPPADERAPGDDDAASQLLAGLADDFARRYRLGQRPSVEEYAEGHPGLAGAIRELFPALLLMEQQGGLDPALGGGGSTPAAERPGAMVGRYKLLERIGEGGFGVVYMAEQQHPVRRRVALKVIKPGMDTRQVIARFEAERQALAMMDHENIAKVFDAGATDAGQPYFVMELVPGVAITDYCDTNQLPHRERLRLFVQVCRAVQHAHQKGVIHRDLKPTNVLVTLRDGRLVPKVIDFGVAKATGQQPLTERTLFTQFAQWVGTPLYMSPEQAQMGGVDVDTRSDVYSLGVLLYELLTGSTPFDRRRLGGAALDEVRRIIREEEPPRPSTRLSTAAAAAAPSVAPARRVELRRLSGLLRGELDWVVMRCLEKDRARRYETVDALARDVERYLRDEAVQACPPSAPYRLRKLVRRHKGPVLTGLLIALALAGGMIGTTAGLIRAHAAQSRAVDQAAQKEEALKGKEAALAAARRSERAGAEQLWAALVAQARANRLSGRAGQRFETIEILNRATELARTLGLPRQKWDELRDVATAALALPDIDLAGPWNPWPADAHGFDFDESHALYARTDGSGNCSVRRVADDQELYRLPGTGRPAWPTFSRDGRFIAVKHGRKEGDVSVHLWQLDASSSRRLLAEEGARWVNFRDSTLVALGYHDGTVGVFELPTGRTLSRFPPETMTREVGVALHPRDPVVAVWSYFFSLLQLRDLTSGRVIASAPLPTGATSVAWQPGGQHLAVGFGDRPLVSLYDRATLRPYRTLEVGQFGLEVCFNPAGDRLLTNSWGSVLTLFDADTGQRLWTTPPVFSSLRFNQNGTGVAGGIRAGRLGAWRLADGREYRTLAFAGLPDKGEYFDAAISSDGRRLAAAVTDGFVVWDLPTGRELAFVPAPGREHRVLFESAESLLTQSESGVERRRITDDPDFVGRRGSVGRAESLPLPRGCGLSRSQDGKVIVSCSRAVGYMEPYAGGWILHQDRPGRPIRIDAGADIVHVAVSPDGQWVVTYALDTYVTKVWDARDGRLVKQLAGSGVGYPCFSPDGRWIRVGNDGGRLVAVGTWEPATPIVPGAAFAPDGGLMALATPAGVRLFDRATDRTVATLEGPTLDLALQVFFSPDGTKLIDLAHEKGVRVWDLRLVRKHLKEMGLDWEWPEFPAEPVGAIPSPERRLLDD